MRDPVDGRPALVLFFSLPHCELWPSGWGGAGFEEFSVPSHGNSAGWFSAWMLPTINREEPFPDAPRIQPESLMRRVDYPHPALPVPRVNPHFDPHRETAPPPLPPKSPQCPSTTAPSRGLPRPATRLTWVASLPGLSVFLKKFHRCAGLAKNKRVKTKAPSHNETRQS